MIFRRKIKAKHRPKDGLSRTENLISQPHTKHRVFNNPDVLTRGWYPVCASGEILKNEAKSFRIAKQRVVLFRSESNTLKALDAFCPHLGADLGNGRVVGENIQCYFHQWEFGGDGCLKKIPCQPELNESFNKVKNLSYPVKELYGHIWVYSHPEAAHSMLKPSGLEQSDVSAYYFGEVELFAHHHVMMANGVDLQHFATVHDLDIKFDFDIDENNDGTFIWRLKGKIPDDNFKGRLARFLLGDEAEYHVKFGGGSVVTISYGVNAKIFGKPVPTLNVLWGCLPNDNGLSRVRIFFVTKKRYGLIGRLKSAVLHVLTVGLLVMLRDEDIEAFPNMRFNTHRLIKADTSLGRFIQLIDKCELSDWAGINDS
ncbi:MAG: aromatic ring-hydroxylating dioxygenase subunit alpha [Pseudomonadales bacterium]|nr:aromatic ring-hydroxylating dioxygenase subunit alpha [Pseudomonadales bacterium]